MSKFDEHIKLAMEELDEAIRRKEEEVIELKSRRDDIWKICYPPKKEEHSLTSSSYSDFAAEDVEDKRQVQEEIPKPKSKATKVICDVCETEMNSGSMSKHRRSIEHLKCLEKLKKK